MYLDHLKLSISNGKDSTEFWAAGLDLNVVTITSDDVKLLWVCSVPDNCKQGPFLGGGGGDERGGGGGGGHQTGI